MRVPKAVELLSLLPKRPVEFYDRVMTVVESTGDRVRGFQGAQERTLTFPEALSAGLGIPGREVAKFLAEEELQRLEHSISAQVAAQNGDGPFNVGHNGNFCLARSIYVICRVLRPEVVVETGVAYGVTSAFTLQAMAVNGKGTLISIDLPPLAPDADRHVGRLIPQDLRKRWSLHRGTAKRRLPALLSSIEEIDVFVHDSLHTYRHMTFEFDAAWPRVRPGGALIADNVDLNNAFRDFVANSKPEFSAVVYEENTTDLFGMITKRG